MPERLTKTDRDWQHQHYVAAGKDYGNKHFTRSESEFTDWILGEIAAVNPRANSIAEIGAGTCVFASLLGRMLQSDKPVTCYEPVAELLEAATTYDNIEVTCGDAVEFARCAQPESYDLVFTKDAAHHFAPETLDEVHAGICDKLLPGGYYVMVVRTPPEDEEVPVGKIAASKWPDLYTSRDELMASLTSIDLWQQVNTDRWEKLVSTPVMEWLEGIRWRDTWSVFSALTSEEIEETIGELKMRFGGREQFAFLHQYDVGVFKKA
jgi:SAM-dependent methyltransferase